MGVQKHLFVIERNVIKELLKLKNQRLFIFLQITLKRSRAPRRSPGMLSSMFEGVFLECKNSLWAIVNRE